MLVLVAGLSSAISTDIIIVLGNFFESFKQHFMQKHQTSRKFECDYAVRIWATQSPASIWSIHDMYASNAHSNTARSDSIIIFVTEEFDIFFF